MKHYHYFIAAGAELDESSRFFLVPIGVSKVDTRDFLYLTSFAVSHGCFFSINSTDVSVFVSRCLASLSLSLDVVRVVSCRDLVRALKAGTLPAPAVPSSAAIVQRMALDSSYRYSVLAQRSLLSVTTSKT